MVLNVRGLKESISSEKGHSAALLGNSSSNNLSVYFTKMSKAVPGLLHYLMSSNLIGLILLVIGFEDGDSAFDTST